MNIGMVGLGKMGANMARRLIKAGHSVVGYNLTGDITNQLATEVGLIPSYSLEDLVEKLDRPKIVWIMVPAGVPVEHTVQNLYELLSAGDIVIDGGNSNFNHSIKRADFLSGKEIQFMDAGVSGGIWGLEEGYSMMVGGEKSTLEQVKPIFEALAPTPDQGWGLMGPVGSGHYVKMVHNGIEYGLMQAYAEGFEIMKARKGFDLDLHQIAETWRYGSVVRSWLLDLTANALENDQELSAIAGYVPDSGEGRWTVFEAINQDVPAPVITLSLMQRFSSRQDESYAAKILAAMRNQFGGHAVKKAKK
ncbi:MAG: decarboxylating 6-phosphogluconate dehydrogenase [Chloroflexi bacterium]|jgi:6-phosphogluconate dehydrogenase|nr:decarboxylating 6-phosphogluconate dehydrogenase [Chloroflexota bacterium]MBT3668945.1 decarboxylating 6-phosphogluconate dehydrogenase [Chloroflexota bacterium]MBT4003119.1 decarboxylating 6-phosphogluconate dehydrogenase [Chloroflexota bacterium]MBT4305328.1 decarboxylating 6-phosphogluconate dehydrogenase [Chloroflexota bacterium]MBT4532474.1 decarboxylating 6-phosphogluconate dehydrogenase [Chloroflexota bacterium]